MSGKKLRYALLVGALVVAMGCKKTPPAPPPPPPPPPAAKTEAPKPAVPTITNFAVEPTSIQRGQSGTLRWTVTGADSVTIDQGVGTVAANGNRSVSPAARTTYRLTARNAGGESNAVAILNVSDPAPAAPPPPPPPPAAPKLTITERLSRDVQDVFFDYDHYDVRDDATATLQKNATALRAILADFPNANITLEGHCDERGSAEYNLGLGDRRASSVRDFLSSAGLAAAKLQPVSYGKEKPQCSEESEDCYQKNRRVHFVAQ